MRPKVRTRFSKILSQVFPILLVFQTGSLPSLRSSETFTLTIQFPLSIGLVSGCLKVSFSDSLYQVVFCNSGARLLFSEVADYSIFQLATHFDPSDSRVPPAAATTITGYTYDVALDTPIYAQLPHRRKPVLPRWYRALSYRNSKADGTTNTWVPTTCSDLASLTSAGINRLEHRPQTEAHSLCLGRNEITLRVHLQRQPPL